MPESIIPREIEEEMKQSYVDYAMSVIVGRALPEVRDGLKPVHRRVLFAMSDLGMQHSKPFKKSARVVGEVLGKYHPHGDIAVYDALVRMAQDFSLRYPLVDGQGNFGSVDGDSPASLRYTECRLTPLAEEMLQDIDKETVGFKDNFDGTLQEPLVLPGKVPNLLLNGSAGIAVGMATNIPPHNLRETADAVIAAINNPEITTDDLLQLIPGPDFPTGATIVGRNALRQAYREGRGIVTVRAVVEKEVDKKGDIKLIVTEIPYMVNKAEMIEQIAELVKDKKIAGIKDINDESDRDGIRVVIELKKEADPDVTLNQLFRYTRLSTSFGINLLSLVDNEPKVLTLKDMLLQFILHRKEVIRRRTQFDLNKAEEAVHILEGLLVALDRIDAVVAGIRQSKDADEAKQFLIAAYALSDKQAKAILEMRLQKLAALEQQKIRDEKMELDQNIVEYKSILASGQRILEIIKKETLVLKEKYGDARRTRIIEGEEEEVEEERLIPKEDVVVTITHAGYIKRLPIASYRRQKRGGKGVTAAGMKDEDFAEHLFIASTHDYLLCITNRGQLYWLRVYDVPEAGRIAKGKNVASLTNIAAEEKIEAVVPVADFPGDRYLMMATKNGTAKKTPLVEFSNIRKNGIRALQLEEKDELVGAAVTDGKKQIIVATRDGMAIRFDENDIRPMGRTAYGVRGIRLEQGDEVIGMVVDDESKKLLTIMEHGYGKRTPIAEYRLISRGGKGVTNANITEKNGKVVAIASVDGSEELMLISKNGIAIRIAAKDISEVGRNTQGVRIMRLEENDRIVAVAKIVKEEETNGVQTNSADGNGAGGNNTVSDETQKGDSAASDDSTAAE